MFYSFSGGYNKARLFVNRKKHTTNYGTKKKYN